MFFYDSQTKQEQENYKTYLSLLCSLSRLFSNSNAPYLYYRGAENVFCKAFNADNLSRSDCSADARKNKIGIGLKTFLHGRGQTLQKVAEFNSDQKNYSQLLNKPEKFIEHIAQLRNNRIEFTKRSYDIENMIYHCVTREKNKINLYEMPMQLIDLDSIEIQKSSSSSIVFKDEFNEYNFNISKSTLLKRFVTINKTVSIPIEILEDPIELLLKLKLSESPIIAEEKETEFVILPLYSTRLSTEDKKSVGESSGLNQWNGKGRSRNPDEVYIPIPSWIHKSFKDFFPHRDIDFKLILPNKTEIKASLCQTGDKGLMSNPNKDLGHWLLRTVLQLKKNKLATYKHLEKIGTDSVRIDKIDQNTYTINFLEIGSFQDFEEKNKI